MTYLNRIPVQHIPLSYYHRPPLYSVTIRYIVSLFYPLHCAQHPLTSLLHPLILPIHTITSHHTIPHSTTHTTDQYSLGASSAITDVATIGAIEDAIKDGSNWVLKPQREGGGNNLYGVELSAFLKKNREDPVLSGMTYSILCTISTSV
jgi:Eukaryotic glutathione synthase, ATP binding domain